MWRVVLWILSIIALLTSAAMEAPWPATAAASVAWLTLTGVVSAWGANRDAVARNHLLPAVDDETAKVVRLLNTPHWLRAEGMLHTADLIGVMYGDLTDEPGDARPSPGIRVDYECGCSVTGGVDHPARNLCARHEARAAGDRAAATIRAEWEAHRAAHRPESGGVDATSAWVDKNCGCRYYAWPRKDGHVISRCGVHRDPVVDRDVSRETPDQAAVHTRALELMIGDLKRSLDQALDRTDDALTDARKSYYWLGSR